MAGNGAPVAAAPTGKRVVVGAGPSGLSAAYHLTRLGHAVTIKDAGSEPGGMMASAGRIALWPTALNLLVP